MVFTRASRLAAGLVFVTLVGCLTTTRGPAVQGSGVSATEKRTVADFTEVTVSGAVQVDLTVGSAAGLEVTCDDNILPHVVTEVADGRLKIRVDGDISTKLGIQVKATTTRLTALNGSGAITATVSGVQAEGFKLDLSGASRCTLSGRADKLTADCSGASHLDATGLTAKSVRASASGASTADVKATDELVGEASGASRIRYVGTPGKVTNSSSGASSVGPK